MSVKLMSQSKYQVEIVYQRRSDFVQCSERANVFSWKPDTDMAPDKKSNPYPAPPAFVSSFWSLGYKAFLK